MGQDLIDVLEATYVLDGSDETWMRGVLEPVRRIVSPDLSAVGYFYDAASADYVERIRPVVIGLSEQQADPIASGILESGAVMRHFEQTTPPIGTASASLGGENWHQILPMLRDALANAGVQDVIGMRIEDPSGRGCVLGATLPKTMTLTRAELRLWQRVCAHVAAALRLRRRVSGAGRIETADAVLTPGGRVEHAAGDARSQTALASLSEAARAMDRARTRVRRVDQEEALELWRALVAERWSLVDEFEHDGRRYVVAHRNSPVDVAPADLTERERRIAAYAALGHPNKLIAYELGLATSTVSSALVSIMRKLGVTSRVALIRKLRAHAAPAVTD